MILRSALITLCFYSPVLADDVTQDFLEQPGIVWISAQLPASALAGLTVPTVPFLRFEDGHFSSGFLSGSPFIYDAGCEDMMTCETRTTEGIAHSGTYTLAGGVVTSTDAQRGTWHFDRPESDLASYSGDAMFGGTAILRREGDSLVQSRPDGDRRYIPLPEEMRFSALRLVVAQNESLTTNYDCAVDAVYNLTLVPNDERDAHQLQLASLITLYDFMVEVANTSELSNHLVVPQSQMTEEMRAANDQLMMGHSMSFLFSNLAYGARERPEAVVDGAYVPDAEELELQNSTLEMFAERVEDTDNYRRLYQSLYPHMLRAVVLVGEIDQARIEGRVDPLRYAICGEVR